MKRSISLTFSVITPLQNEGFRLKFWGKNWNLQLRTWVWISRWICYNAIAWIFGLWRFWCKEQYKWFFNWGLLHKCEPFGWDVHGWIEACSFGTFSFMEMNKSENHFLIEISQTEKPSQTFLIFWSLTQWRNSMNFHLNIFLQAWSFGLGHWWKKSTQ